MKKSKLLLMLVALLMGLSPTQADELTVCDGTTTNKYVPLYGYYADEVGTQSEFIVPASMLADMNGGSITSLKFYTDSNVSWGALQVKIYVKEVTEESLATGFVGEDGASVVYTGSFTVESKEVTVPFSEAFSYSGGNLLVGLKVTTKGTYANGYFYGKGGYDVAYGRSKANSGSAVAQYFIPKTTFTYETAADGPALRVNGYKNGDTFAFGMVNPGTEKTLTLKNPGTEAITVKVATTGGFTAAPSSVTINAKGEAQLTITAPDATANGTVTITPTVDGVDAIAINLTATVKDPNKMFVDFAEGVLPEEWSETHYGGYSNYIWTFGSDASGSYAGYSGTSSSSVGTLTSPLLQFDADEQLFFNTAKYGSSSYTTPSISLQVSTDGETWTTVQTFTDDTYGTWTTRSVTIPSGTKYIRFRGWYVYLTNIYGGAYSDAPVMTVTASDIAFGMVAAEASKTFTIKNIGKSPLTGISITSSSSDFTITGVPTTLAADEEATITIAMTVATTGAKTGTVTVSAPEQETTTFNVSGYVMDNTLFTETFDGNALPNGWENAGWTFSDGAAVGAYQYGTTKTLTTPSLVVAAGEKMALEAKLTRSGYYSLPIYISKDGGDFTLRQEIPTSDLSADEYRVFYIEGLEAGNYKIQFKADGAQINAVNGFHLNMNAPEMTMTPTTAAAFGKMTASGSKTYTVANTGTGTLVVNITSNSSDFTVSPATLEVTDEPKEFTVTFNYTEGNYGLKEGVITVTPTYNENAAITINASAKTTDPNAWDEDFEEGTMPVGWEADGFSVGNGTYNNNPNDTYIAQSSKSGAWLVTPRLEAKAGDVLTWEAYFDWYDEGIRVEYSTDEQATWTEATLDGLVMSKPASAAFNAYCPNANGFVNRERGTKLDMSFTAPADGFYYLRFTSSYNGNAVDNFNGLKLALKDHDMKIADQSIPTTRTQYQETNVSVTLTELVGKDEEVSVKFFIGDVQYGETVVQTIAAGTSEEVIVTFTPTEALAGEAYFTVENDNINLTSESVSITINPALVLDETVDPGTIPTNTGYGTTPVVVVKYTPKAGWNTIALPFRMFDSDLTTIFGEGWKAYEFKSYSNGVLGFDVASNFWAGYPYIIYAPNADPTVSEHIFKVVSVSTATAKSDQYGEAVFQGTFSPVAAPDMEGLYGVVPSTGRIQKGSATASLKGFRGYFELPADADPAKIALDFGDGTVITGIDAIGSIFGATGDVYDLNGRKVADAKTAKQANLPKGVYIQNGKKLVIK